MDLATWIKTSGVIWTVPGANRARCTLLATQTCSQIRLTPAELVFDVLGHVLVSSLIVPVKLRSLRFVGKQGLLATSESRKTRQSKKRGPEREPGWLVESWLGRLV